MTHGAYPPPPPAPLPPLTQGGELRALTKNVEMSREVTMDRMVGAAMGKGAQGIIAFRFDASGSGQSSLLPALTCLAFHREASSH